MRAFIVRPFGRKKDLQGNEIDFDEVERVLIAPALKAVDAEGGTTIDIVEAGNIRTDMFRRLLTADLVVADLSIHNANVFYELGIRHALREHGTFMLRSDSDAYPFDLQTDRYFVYNRENPAASLGGLTLALERTKDAQEKNAAVKDSPIFAALPLLGEADPSLFNIMPHDFLEDVARVAEAGCAGDLALFSYEIRGFEWEAAGWRAVGLAQSELQAWVGAKETWERVRELEPNDPEANLQLKTIYEQLDDIARANEALERLGDNAGAEPAEPGEEYILQGHDAKMRWRQDWEGRPPEERAATALRSPHLQAAFEHYERAFKENINYFDPGMRALEMLKLMIALAESLPEVWSENFDSDREAERELDEHRERAAKLTAVVDFAISSNVEGAERSGMRNEWAELAAADLRYVTTEAPARVAATYRKALAAAPDFVFDHVRMQLAIYRDLGVLGANLAAVIKVVGEPLPIEPAHAEVAPAGEPAPRRARACCSSPAT